MEEKDKFPIQKYIFTDSRICSIAQLLWNYDTNKKFVVDTTRNVEYYETFLENTDITMLVLNEEYNRYNEQDKYSFLIFLYILHKSPILFQNYKECPKDISLNITKKDLMETFNLTLKNFSARDYIESLHKLLSLRITYDYTDKDGRTLKRISNLINSIDYDKERPEKYCKITLSRWVRELFSNIEYINNKFYEGELDYTPFIKGSNKKTECMNLPQKFVELYRANENKKGKRKVYDNEKYFVELFNTDKILRKRVIENVISNINTALLKSNLKIVFDCEFTPAKFKRGHFSIVPLDFEFDKEEK